MLKFFVRLILISVLLLIGVLTYQFFTGSEITPVKLIAEKTMSFFEKEKNKVLLSKNIEKIKITKDFDKTDLKLKEEDKAKEDKEVKEVKVKEIKENKIIITTPLARVSTKEKIYIAKKANLNYEEAFPLYETSVYEPYREELDSVAPNIPDTDSVMVSEGGSTPVEKILGTVSSPVRNLDYELNKVEILPNGDVKVFWMIHNTSRKNIRITSDLKNQLSPTKLHVVDFKYDKRFTVKYDNFIPRANCMLAEIIPAKGRVFCSALVGPQFRNMPGVLDNRVAVYLPGRYRTPLKVFIDI